MNRRTFVKNSIPLLAVPTLVKGIPISVLTGPAIDDIQVPVNKMLVIIELKGGNDGLNTIIPLDQYKNLTEARRNILIPEKKVIPLADTNIVGLHPSLKPLQSLYNDKMMSVVQGVGYSDFSFSHFRAFDIFQTASGAENTFPDGYIGRYLRQQNRQYPEGYPNEKKPDPLAIGVGDVAVSTVLQGNGISMGIAIGASNDFYSMISSVSLEPPPTNAGKEIGFSRQTSFLVAQYGKAIQAAARKQQDQSQKYPKGNQLAENLKIIAQLIGGGLQTSVYITAQSNFDHHNAQVDTADPTKGSHAHLLQQFSGAITAFLDDLHRMGVQDKVVCMVNSEFGRRIKSNASYGTDHGSAQPFMFFGTQLKGGIIGTNPVIPANVSVADNLEMQHDYRAIYSSVLKKWFSASDEDIAVSVPGNYQQLDLFK